MTADNIQSAGKLLPISEDDKEKFGKELTALCSELLPTAHKIRQILAAKFKASDLLHLCYLFAPKIIVNNPDYSHHDKWDNGLVIIMHNLVSLSSVLLIQKPSHT